jgi:hypothetical protein
MNQVTTLDSGFSIVRNAKVEVNRVFQNGKESAQIIVGDSFNHIFKHDNTVSQSLILGAQAVADQLNGGTYFFHGDKLVSYRNGNHKGFVHTDDSINKLIEHIGYTTKFSKSQYHSNSTDAIRLQNVHSNVEMQIEQYATGGEMNSQLSFAWDPFQSHIRAVFQLVRQICSNGMVGMADFMNAKIPVINEWQQHMEIANKQIQNKITSMVNSRMQIMAENRASVRDCQRIVEACHKRLNDLEVHQDPLEVDRIRKICLVADPAIHLKDHYGVRVLEDKRLGEQAASHLTEFTAWNMLTELASHTRQTSANSNTALHKHANELLIDRAGNKVTNARQTAETNVQVKFDDLDAAFAGDLLEMI